MWINMVVHEEDLGIQAGFNPVEQKPASRRTGSILAWTVSTFWRYPGAGSRCMTAGPSRCISTARNSGKDQTAEALMVDCGGKKARQLDWPTGYASEPIQPAPPADRDGRTRIHNPHHASDLRRCLLFNRLTSPLL